MILLLSCLSLSLASRFHGLETKEVVDTDIPENFKLNSTNPSDKVSLLYSPPAIKSSKLLILIKGRITNYDIRQSIRQQYQNRTKISLRFIVGTSKNRAILGNINHENKLHDDIIIGDFDDTYENLVFKSLTGLSYVAKYGQNAEYTIFMDDDVDLNLDALTFLLSQKSKRKSEKVPYILCPWKNPKQARVTRRGPWAVSEAAYSGTHWPSYCGGACYLMNTQAIESLNESVRYMRHAVNVAVEDTFVTGILRKRSAIDIHTTTPLCKHNVKEDSITGQFLKNKQL